VGRTVGVTLTAGATTYGVPGVRLEVVVPASPPILLTGVPVFLGYAGEPGGPHELLSWQAFQAFQAAVGTSPPDGYLAVAVHAFFAAGGRVCHVVGLDATLPAAEALQRGLDAVADLDAADLVCAPDIMRATVLADGDPPAVAAALQALILADCRRVGGRFAILDAVPDAAPETVMTKQRGLLDGADGALYHPWPWAAGPNGTLQYVPPCGYVAAVYARSDATAGVHRAPANEVLDGVLDLQTDLTEADAAALTAAGVNCLLARPGRGIRVWGARTLSRDPAWRHVGARRVLLTVGRWLERFLQGTVHEPHDLRLRVRVMREVSAYLESLHGVGALRGRTPDEAFFVKCDAETNPPELTATGVLVTTVGLALAAPAEFLVLRITRGASGVTAGPSPTST
jgi:phage tail sheath protein FI